MPLKSKRQLEDPNDISIARAPQAPKKTRKMPATGVTGSETTSAPNTILPASITNPAPSDLTLAPAAGILGDGGEPTAATKGKAPAKKRAKKGAAATNLIDTLPTAAFEIPPAPPENSVSESAPASDVKTSDKRVKTASFLAKQVAIQVAVENESKAAKTKKKDKKAASTVINETPEETHAFLERVRSSLAGGPPNATTSDAMESVTTIAPASIAPDSTTSYNNKPALTKRSALSQMTLAHQSTATPPTSVVSTASSFSSLTPSESVSQGKPAAASPEAPSRARPKKKSKAPTLSLLDVPDSAPPSHDVSPLPEQLADGDLAKYGDDREVDLATILNGIPKEFAPILQMPDPLPPPLYIPERRVPLPPIDLDALPAPERAKLKAKRQLKVKDLKAVDQSVVSSALSRMGALLVVVCGFPDGDTAWLLACNANYWASKKHGRHLQLTRDSEYAKILYDRIPQMRSGLVSDKKRADVAVTYELKSGTAPAVIAANREKVEDLLKDVNFTLPSLDRLDAMYENGIFQDLMKFALFRSADAIGVVHSDLFKTITLPCMALTATAVEKVIASYKTGVHVDSKFNAVEFTPVYLSHLLTLADTFNTPESHSQLLNHLQRVADELRAPFRTTIQAQGVISVKSRVSRTLIAARYRSEGSGAPGNTRSRTRLPNTPVPAPAQELVCRVKMRLGPATAPRPVSASSTPESEVVGAIYSAAQDSRHTGPEDFAPLLAGVTGSSDSEVQAERAGALKPNVAHAGGTMLVEQPGGDGNQYQGRRRVLPVKSPTLSSSSDDSSETDGEGKKGLIGATLTQGDVSMRTAGASSSSSDSSGLGDEGEGEGEDGEG